MERKSGILMHVSSLFGRYSIGSFSSAAKYFVDLLSDSGFSFWQVLPFCTPDEHGSPYSSCSFFGANPYFIDLTQLYEKGLLTREELRGAEERTPYICEYQRLFRERIPLLRLATSRVAKRVAITDFCQGKPYLQNAAEFMALKVKNGGLPWWRWENMRPDKDELFFWQFIQYEFFHEWEKIKSYANSRNIFIIGDMPMYVSHDSADVFGSPDEFLLDEDNMPSCVGGVPPDYFSESGQIWYTPIYDWKKMKKNGYLLWRSRIKHMLSLFDGVRIDHFRALEAYWSIPRGAKSARVGSWEKGPGRSLINVIKEITGDKLVIAEDLGSLTDRVEALRRYSGFLSSKVLQFGFRGGNSPHLPHNYTQNTVAYTGTHDNSTLLGYLLEADEWERHNMLVYACAERESVDLWCEHIIRCMLASPAGVVIFPIQDILAFGNDTRMNTPGRAENNWAYRVTKAQLDSIDRGRWKYFNSLYARL